MSQRASGLSVMTVLAFCFVATWIRRRDDHVKKRKSPAQQRDLNR